VARAQDEPPAAQEPPAAEEPKAVEEPACPPGMEPAPPPAPAPAPEVRHKPRAAFSPDNMSLTVGGGVGNFVRDRISDLNSSVAGTWDARFLYGTRHYLGVEAAYQGTAAGSSADFGTGSVSTTQVTGSLRFNMTRLRIQPFLAAGAGWMLLHRGQSGPAEALVASSNTNSFVVPFAGGIAGYFGRHGTVDVRGTYALVTDKDFTNTGARPDMWTAELRAGYAF
jgi:hypothetical protein